MEKRSVAIIHQSKLGLILPRGNIWRVPSLSSGDPESIYRALAHATDASIHHNPIVQCTEFQTGTTGLLKKISEMLMEKMRPHYQMFILY